jgi:hypothetical protein
MQVQRPGLRQLFDIDLQNLKRVAEQLDKQDEATRDFKGIYEVGAPSQRASATLWHLLSLLHAHPASQASQWQPMCYEHANKILHAHKHAFSALELARALVPALNMACALCMACKSKAQRP